LPKWLECYSRHAPDRLVRIKSSGYISSLTPAAIHSQFDASSSVSHHAVTLRRRRRWRRRCPGLWLLLQVIVSAQSSHSVFIRIPRRPALDARNQEATRRD